MVAVYVADLCGFRGIIALIFGREIATGLRVGSKVKVL